MTTEKQETMEWEQKIDTSYKEAIEAGLNPEYLKILNKAIHDNYKKFIRSEIQAAVQKAREEMAQEIVENISLSISKNTYVTIGISDQTEGYKYGLDESKNIVAKYLPSGKAGGQKSKER